MKILSCAITSKDLEEIKKEIGNKKIICTYGVNTYECCLDEKTIDIDIDIDVFEDEYELSTLDFYACFRDFDLDACDKILCKIDVPEKEYEDFKKWLNNKIEY